MVKKYIVGFLVLVILSASLYVLMPESVKVLVENTRTKYYVWENDSWILGGTEYVNLFDGATKMRAKSRSINQTVNGESITIVRTSTWKDNITTIQTYNFDGSIDDVEMVPVENKFECFNCEGKIVHYEFRDISYGGITRPAISPENFGHNIKVEWQDGYEWAKVYQQKVASDKLIIRYKPTSDYAVYNVRLFDPIFYGTGDDSNLVLHIPFEGDFRDISGQGNDGTQSGGVSITRGVKGRGGEFDGVDTYVLVSDDSAFDGNGDFSVSFWVNTFDNGGIQRLVNKGNVDAGAPGIGWEIEISSADKLVFFINNQTGGPVPVQAVAPFTTDCGGTCYNKWTHVVGVWNSTMAKVYLDGVLSDDSDVVSNIVYDNALDIYIGERSGGTGANLDGTLDEVRIYNTSLSATEVASLYNSTKSYHLQLKTNPALGLADETGLVGYWKLDGDALDSSGQGNDGTVTGATLTNEGRFKEAYDFNNNGYINITNPTTLGEMDTLTVSYWFNADNWEAWDILFMARYSDTSSYYCQVDASDRPFCVVRNSTGSTTTSNTGTVIKTGGWHHIVMTYDGSWVKVYLDGGSANSNNLAGPVILVTEFYIGSNRDTQYFDGKIDEFKIYNRSLSATEVAELYTGTKSNHLKLKSNPALGLADETGLVGYWKLDGDALDSSGQGNDGTVTGATLTNEGRFKEAYDFDGVDDFINITGFSTHYPSFTASAWFKTNNEGTTQTIVTKEFTFILRYENTDGLFGYFYDGSWSSLEGTTALSKNTWYHAAVSFNGTYAWLYLNGQEEINGTDAILSNTKIYEIGSRIGIQWFNGTIDEVRIYNRSLSATEVAELYTGTKTNHFKLEGVIG